MPRDTREEPSRSCWEEEAGSEMFSLSALTARAASSLPPPTVTTVDDSGTIDLKALSAEADTVSTANLMPAHVPLFLFDVPVEPQPTELQPVNASGTTANRGLGFRLAAAALVVLALVTVVAVVVARDRMEITAVPPEPALAAIHPALAAAEAPEAEAKAVVAPPAAPVVAPSSGKTEPGATALAPKTNRGPEAIPHKESTRREAPAMAKKNRQTPPASDPCKGNLMCAMQRAVVR